MIRFLYSNLQYVLRLTYPVLLLSLVLFLIVRLSFLRKNQRRFILYKECFLLFFVMYLLCLFQVVTNGDMNTSFGNNWVPFVEIMRYKPFSRLFIKNIVGNVVLFIPYGFFVGKYASGKHFFLTVFLVFLASFSIECTQLSIGRVFDVDDILLNEIGGLLGYGIYFLVSFIYQKLPTRWKGEKEKNVVAGILSILALLGVFIMIW